MKEAAILKDGIVYLGKSGKRHNHIIKDYPEIRFFTKEQGFITNEGKFVDRVEAAKIAFECGQIKKEKRILFSEDLY